MAEIEVSNINKNVEQENITEVSKAEKETVKVVKEAETRDISSLEINIIRQMEYYFGDINLPRDKFLLEQIKQDNGWIPLEVMLKFKRLALLSTDLEIIGNSVKKSPSGLLEVSEDGEKIRRNPDKILPQQNEERKKELQDRAVYCKGFPLDSTLDTLLEYFQQYGPIDCVVMRKYRITDTTHFKFKGSVFVVFSTKEKAEEFLKIEEVKFGETVLLRHWQADYMEIKREERKAKDRKVDNEKSEVEEQKYKCFPKGTILGMQGELRKLCRKDIRSKVEELGGKVAFVKCNSGDEGWVRLYKENSAKEVMEKLEDGKLEVKEVSLELRAIEGEEEDTMLKQAMADMMRYQRGGKGGRRGFYSNNCKQK